MKIPLPNALPLTLAGKLQIIAELYLPTIDEDGNEQEPIIKLSKEELLELLNSIQGKEDTQTYCKDCGMATKSGSGSARCPSCWDDRFGGKEK
jgi:tRNA(Ile2) C34 agmatinyltransferase TiaS